MISYAGIPLSRVIYALYHGAKMCPEGTPARMIEEIEGGDLLDEGTVSRDLQDGIRLVRRGQRISIDYYRGRSIKVVIDLSTEQFDGARYDLDNGAGRAEQIIHG